MDEGALLADGLGFLEAPRWIEGSLWFSDFYARRVCSVDGGGNVTEHFYVPGQPSGLGVQPDGGLLVVSVHDGHILRWDGGRPALLADVGAHYRGGLNDMVTDRRGRAYVSTFPVPAAHGDEVSREPAAPIILVDTDGSVRTAADGLKIANGLIITPGGERLIVAETLGARLLAYDIDWKTGDLGDPQVFAELGSRKPDGICLDEAGNVWVGSYATSEFVLVSEGGEVLRSIPTGGRWAVACALGGDDGRTLFGLVMDVSVDSYLDGRGTGNIVTYRVDVPAAKSS